MLKINYGTTQDTRSYVLNTVASKKQTQEYRVIDIGGVAGEGWTTPIADMVIDILAANTNHSLSLDICNYESWRSLEEIVQANGRYDYAICTHTLEDLYDPFIALQKLPKIAKQGIITMPSIRSELSNVESQYWVGYIHHRWLFDKLGDQMLIVPKLNALELLCDKGRFPASQEEICYEWSEDIPYKMFMDNYLGPNVDVVIENYDRLLNNIE
ncbi:hypothetical protein SOV_08270 [Sporomusa ovata DSM 2662]|uniref:Uncharacterized protein n=1 Tax=Sporomusa ovata TaxID=2378 RepID=A0A0U1L6P2_9FIRM|nr:hypothetical protein [Sporomusa ovata]EQB28479.1 hypothetical protein SOV_1c01650 [Sporomusa ovata DSM 2662]CQR74803.1 hypothetical protein SpAn4DRAFT_4160 [Sporomusa ovata]